MTSLSVALAMAATVFVTFALLAAVSASCAGSSGQLVQGLPEEDQVDSATREVSFPTAFELLDGIVVVEVNDLALTASQSFAGGFINDTFSASIVAVHSQVDAEAHELTERSPVSFLASRWSDEPPLFDSQNRANPTILLRPYDPADTASLGIDYFVQVAFYESEGTVTSSRAGVAMDDHVLDTLKAAVAVAPIGRGEQAASRELSLQLAQITAAIDVDEAEMRKLLTPALPEAPVDLNVSLLNDDGYVPMAFGGSGAGFETLHVVAVRTESGAVSGFAIDEANTFSSTTLPVNAVGEEITIELWRGEPDFGQLVDSTQLRIDETADDEAAVVVTVDPAGSIMVEVVPFASFQDLAAKGR